LPTYDAATCRDIARALEQVVAGILGKPFRTGIGVGASSGAMVLAAFDCGRSVIGTQSVRTGGNNVVPYDTNSARIFNGFILNGFPYTPGVAHVDPALPLSAPRARRDAGARGRLRSARWRREGSERGVRSGKLRWPNPCRAASSSRARASAVSGCP
jgi:hypothetical protein